MPISFHIPFLLLSFWNQKMGESAKISTMKKSESNQIKVKCTIHALSQMYGVGFRAKIQFYRKLPGAIGGEINCNNHHNYSAAECNLSY